MCKYCDLKYDYDEAEYGYDIYSGKDIHGTYIYAYGKNHDKFSILVNCRRATTDVANIKYCPFCGKKLEVKEE